MGRFHCSCSQIEYRNLDVTHNPITSRPILRNILHLLSEKTMNTFTSGLRAALLPLRTVAFCSRGLSTTPARLAPAPAANSDSATHRVFKKGFESPNWRASDKPLPPRVSGVAKAAQAEADAAAQQEAGPQKYYSITLKRSTIGMPEGIKKLVHEDLGFARRLRTVIYPVNASIAGKLLKIKEMIAVEVLEKLPYGARKLGRGENSRWEVPRRLRRGGPPEAGFRKIGSLMPKAGEIDV